MFVWNSRSNNLNLLFLIVGCSVSRVGSPYGFWGLELMTWKVTERWLCLSSTLADGCPLGPQYLYFTHFIYQTWACILPWDHSWGLNGDPFSSEVVYRLIGKTGTETGNCKTVWYMLRVKGPLRDDDRDTEESNCSTAWISPVSGNSLS